MLELVPVSASFPLILEDMAEHYSRPRGFFGKRIAYAIIWNKDDYFGSIVGGSATLNLPGRNEFFDGVHLLSNIVNNVFYHLRRGPDGGYPLRNFAQRVLKMYRAQIEADWLAAYGIPVLGHETLIELPRRGEIYRRDGWIETGTTKGFTCKSRGGERTWDYNDLKPKLVLCRYSDNHTLAKEAS